MIIKIYDDIPPARITMPISEKERVGWAIYGLIQNDIWARLAREVVTPPPLGGARVVRRIRREGGALLEIHIQCSRKTFEEVANWMRLLQLRGWWGGPIPRPEEEYDKWAEEIARRFPWMANRK